MTTRKAIVIYTDGSCLDNGKENACGGWAAILTCGNHRREIYGGEVGTKNNRMELKAAIEAVKLIKVPAEITIVTDSQYVCRCFSSMREWYNSGWKTKSGAKPKNLDLLQELMEIGKAGHHKFHFQYVQGHSGHPENERCDALARAEARALQKVQVVE